MPSINFNLDDVKPLLSTLGLGQSPSTTAPAVNDLPTPPMPQPPTPAAAGFKEWASDPQNQQKVADGITNPGTPLLPANIPPGSPMANIAPPPQQKPMAFLKPPTSGSGEGNTAASQAFPGSAAGGSGLFEKMAASGTTLSNPSTAASPNRNSTAVPAIPPAPTSAPLPQQLKPAFSNPPNQPQTMQQDMAANPGQYQHPTFAKGRGVVGNGLTLLAAGLAGAAGGIGNRDPLAGINYVEQQKAADAAIPAENAAQYRARNIQPIQDQLGIQKTQADLAHTTAETSDIGSKSMQALAVHGLKSVTDPATNITTVVPDTDSPVYKAQQDKDAKLQQQTDLIGAQIDNTKAQKELRDAQTAFTQSKNDPNSPAYQFNMKRLAVAQQNATAAGIRAQAYMGNYLKGAYNKGLNGQDLPGAPSISDDNGNQTTVGATNAGTAIKNQSNAAQFNDVHGALDSLENAATTLVQKGGKLNSPGVAAALSQPAGTLGQWLQGEGVKANLTPEERNYVTAVAAAHENVQALRKSAGGTATDSSVAKLDALIPGASTPDIDYLKRQTGQIRATAERLGKGATVATGGLKVRGQGITAPPTSGNTGKITVTAPDGSVHPFATQQQANTFKKLAGIK